MIPRQFALATVILCCLAIGMSVYVWQLRRREALNPQPSVPAQHVSPPTLGPMEKVTVYVAYDDPWELRA